MQDELALWSAFLYGTVLRVSLVLLLGAVAVQLMREASAATRSVVYGGVIVLVVAIPFGKSMPALYPAEILPSVLATPLVETGILAFVDELQASVGKLGGEPVNRDAFTLVTWILVLVLGAWACGALLVAIRTAIQWTRVLQLVRGGTPCHDAQLNDILADAKHALSFTSGVRLLVHATHEQPFCWGLFRPAIVIPAAVLQWPREWQRAVLMHELAHARSRDSLLRLLGLVGCMLYWFHPGMWWIARRHQDERERACDDAVVCANVDAAEYALLLLAIDESGVRGAGACAVGQGIGHGAVLRQRVVRLVSRRRIGKAQLRTRVFTPLALGTLGLVLTTIRIAPAPTVTRPMLESSDWVRRGYALGIMSGAGMLRPSSARTIALLQAAKLSDAHPVNRAIAGRALGFQRSAAVTSR